MRLSVRSRLTLWHTATLAVVLTLFAFAAYTFLARATRDRTDRVLAEAADGLAAELVSERAGQSSDLAAAREVVRELRFRSFAFMIFDTAGAVVAARVPPAVRMPAGEPADPPLRASTIGVLVRRTGAGTRAGPGGARLATAPDDEGGYRVAMKPVTLTAATYVAVVASSQHDDTEMLEAARTAITFALPGALLLSALGGSLLARRSLAPVDRALAQQRQFMADASHELRTPAAVVQNEATVALSRPGRSAAEYEDSLRAIRDAGRRLRRIVDDLFLLARADAGDVPLRRVPLYLDEVIAECVRSMRTLAEGRGITITISAAIEASFTGDLELLHRLVCNLLDNAIKHSPPNAVVSVALTRSGDAYELRVRDRGAGIPQELQPRVFERFVRVDSARRRSTASSTSGAGLGLAIARWIVEEHDGTIALERSGPEGSVFVVVLPA